MGHTAWIRVALKKSLVSSNIFESALGLWEDDSTRVRMWVLTVGLRVVRDFWDCYISKRTLTAGQYCSRRAEETRGKQRDKTYGKTELSEERAVEVRDGSRGHCVK